ncbi:MAG: mechanosensitive ion channel family protein [Flavobacteriales bacterium]|nr:mechanosensitive ion channel family protein [Flavobacteriales bacterium]
MNEVTKITKGWGTFDIGPYTFEWSMLVKIAIIIGFSIIALQIVRLVMNRFIHRNSDYLKVDATRLKFFRSALNGLIYSIAFIGVIYVIPPFRAVSVTLLASAGIFAAVLGFASQQAFSNIISGIFVVLSRPFRVGDVIRVGRDGSAANELVGTVEDITLRHTVIRDFQNRRIIIPNSVINMEVITNNNIVDERVRRIMNITVAYETDINKALLVITDEIKKHPYYLDGRTAEEVRLGEPEVNLRVVELGANGVTIRAYIWAANFDLGWDMFCDLNKSILERFKKERIEIPYPHRTIVYKKDISE